MGIQKSEEEMERGIRESMQNRSGKGDSGYRPDVGGRGLNNA